MSRKLLTEEELDDIVNVLPESFAYPGIVRKTQTLRQKLELKNYLKEFEIDERIIEALKIEIRQKYESARVAIGSTVGIAAAEGAGGPMTQLVLNTFHKAGFDGGAIESMKVLSEIFNASKVQKNKTSFLIFSEGLKKVYIPREEILGDDFCHIFVGDNNLTSSYFLKDDKLLFLSKKMSSGKFNFGDVRKLVSGLGFNVTSGQASPFVTVKEGFSSYDQRVAAKINGFCDEIEKWKLGDKSVKDFPKLDSYMLRHTNTIKNFAPPKREDVIIKAMREIVSVTLARLISKVEIITRSSAEFDTEWKKEYLSYDERKKRHHDEKSSKNYPVARIHLNVSKLVRYGLTMSKIVRAIDSYVLRKNIVLLAVPSTMMLGLIDLYVTHNSHSVKKRGATIPSGYIGTNMILTELFPVGAKKIQISGYPGIEEIFPSVKPINLYIKKIEKVGDNKWILSLSVPDIKKGSLKPQQLFLALRELGIMSFTSKDFSKFTVLSDDNPVDIMKARLSEEKRNLRRSVKEWVSGGYIGIRPVMSKIHALLVHVAISTLGSNISMISLNSYLDFDNSVVSDVHEVTKTLGIEAAKQHIVRRLNEVFENENIPVDVRHLKLLSEYMTRTGDLVGATFNGSSKDEVSVLSKASFGKPLDVIADAALFGRTDYLKSLPSAIFLGQVPKIGIYANEDSAATRKKINWIVEKILLVELGEISGRTSPKVVKTKKYVFDNFYIKTKPMSMNLGKLDQVLDLIKVS